VYAVAISPDGKTLVSASADKTVKLWEVATGKELATLKGHTANIWCVAFRPDGKMLASGDGDDTIGTIKLWDTATRKEIASLRGHKALVKCLAFSQDSTRLASGSWDLTVRLWDTQTRKVKAIDCAHPPEVGGVFAMEFAPTARSWYPGPGTGMLGSGTSRRPRNC
jgi:WD40 repeat protein